MKLDSAELSANPSLFQIKFDNIKERVIFSRINPTESLAGVTAAIAVTVVGSSNYIMVHGTNLVNLSDNGQIDQDMMIMTTVMMMMMTGVMMSRTVFLQ